MTSESSTHEAGHSKPVLLDNLDRRGEKGVGGGSGWAGHMYTCGKFMLIYGKIITIL